MCHGRDRTCALAEWRLALAGLGSACWDSHCPEPAGPVCGHRVSCERLALHASSSGGCGALGWCGRAGRSLPLTCISLPILLCLCPEHPGQHAGIREPCSLPVHAGAYPSQLPGTAVSPRACLGCLVRDAEQARGTRLHVLCLGYELTWWHGPWEEPGLGLMPPWGHPGGGCGHWSSCPPSLQPLLLSLSAPHVASFSRAGWQPQPGLVQARGRSRAEPRGNA